MIGEQISKHGKSTAVPHRSEAPAPVDTAVSPPGRTARPAAPVGLDFDVGAALATQAAPSRNDGVLDPALALGLTLVGGVASAAGGLGARLALGASTERAVPLAGGEARWRRATGSLGPMWRLRVGRAPASAPSFDPGTAIDLHAEILLAALDVRGVGFSPNTNGWSFDAGGAAGARVWLGRGRWRPSVDLGLAYWPRDHVAFASPSPDGSRLPRVDVSLALGISFAGPARPGDATPVAAIESSTGP